MPCDVLLGPQYTRFTHNNVTLLWLGLYRSDNQCHTIGVVTSHGIAVVVQR